LPRFATTSKFGEYCLQTTLSVIPFIALSLSVAFAQPSPTPNSDAAYQQLRNISLSGEAVAVSNLTLQRDAGKLLLHSGTVCFVGPVQGKVTGAIFVGDGTLTFDSLPGSEIKTLKLLTKGEEFNESFVQAVLRFTDTTYDEIKKAGTPAGGGCDAGHLKDSFNVMRHQVKTNLEARVLQDVLSAEPGGLFLVFVHGKRYNSKELFIVDRKAHEPGYEVCRRRQNGLVLQRIRIWDSAADIPIRVVI
jgi:hypothetical protein